MPKSFMGLVIYHGEKGLQNGRIQGPKPLSGPLPPFKGVETFVFLYGMAKTSSNLQYNYSQHLGHPTPLYNFSQHLGHPAPSPPSPLSPPSPPYPPSPPLGWLRLILPSPLFFVGAILDLPTTSSNSGAPLPIINDQSLYSGQLKAGFSKIVGRPSHTLSDLKAGDVGNSIRHKLVD